MKRLSRIVLKTATVLSLVMCIVTVAAWLRSYQVRGDVWWALASPRLDLGIGTDRGELFVAVFTPWDDTWVPGGGWEPSIPMDYAKALDPQGKFFSRFGFVFNSFRVKVYAMRQLACPYWFVMLLTAIVPCARLAVQRRRARRLRMHPKLCRHCGYDCRATPDRCPECGTPVAAG